VPSEPSKKWLLRFERLRKRRLKAYLAEDYASANKVEPTIKRMEVLARINGWKLPPFEEENYTNGPHD
jgi:hypothetical protein